MTWTETNISAGAVTKVDNYPLWVVKGDKWELQPSENAAGYDVIIPFKFRLDKNVSYIRFYLTASNSTLKFQIFNEDRLIGETSKTVTTEEDTYLQIDIPNLQTSTEAEIRLLATGNYTIKGDTMKVVAFYLTGWTETKVS